MKPDSQIIHALKSLCTDVDLVLKQIDSSTFDDVGREVFKACFGGFLDWRAAEWNKNIMPTSRRFAGDISLPRGRYFTLAMDGSGYDNENLVGELYAYAAHSGVVDRPGYFEFWDFTIPEQREAALNLLSPKIKQTFKPLISSPILLIGLLPVNGHLHSFAEKYISEVEPLWLCCPFVIQQRRVRNVIDLRVPVVANAFCKIITQECLSPYRKGLDSFYDLLPTILDQELGGGQGFCSAAGICLRQSGIGGLIYPSARTDVYVKVQNGKVMDSGGWIYVEYDGSAPANLTAVVDFAPWRTSIVKAVEGPNTVANKIYKSVKIEYIKEGNEQGSWSVQGLAICQEAFFYLYLVKELIKQLGTDIYEKMELLLEIMFELCDSGVVLFNLAIALRGAALGDKSYKDLLAQQANLFSISGAHGAADIIYEFLSLCPSTDS